MKRWLSRSLWLAAWGVWAWLGVGLHRELPRDLVRVECTLPMGKGVSVLGFVGASDRIALMSVVREPYILSLIVVDAETGSVIQRIESSSLFGVLGDAVRRHGVVFDYDPVRANGAHSVHVLDLSTGERLRVAAGAFREIFVHPVRPWVLLVETLQPEQWRQRVVVHDFAAGRDVFVGESMLIRQLEHVAFFVGEDRMLIPSPKRADPNVDSDQVVAWEVWDLGGSPKRIAEIPRSLGARFSDAVCGRLAFGDSSLSEINVWDVATGRVVFSRHPRELLLGNGTSLTLFPAMLSPSGRTARGGRPFELWNVDTGRLVWREKEHEEPIPVERDQFAVVETWNRLWKDWVPRLELQTHTVRSTEDGRLVYRTMNHSSPSKYVNRDGTLAVSEDGIVYRMPARVNWPLLAICQVILASPLILLWLMLRWRRRRAGQR